MVPVKISLAFLPLISSLAADDRAALKKIFTAPDHLSIAGVLTYSVNKGRTSYSIEFDDTIGDNASRALHAVTSMTKYDPPPPGGKNPPERTTLTSEDIVANSTWRSVWKDNGEIGSIATLDSGGEFGDRPRVSNGIVACGYLPTVWWLKRLDRLIAEASDAQLQPDGKFIIEVKPWGLLDGEIDLRRSVPLRLRHTLRPDDYLKPGATLAEALAKSKNPTAAKSTEWEFREFKEFDGRLFPTRIKGTFRSEGHGGAPHDSTAQEIVVTSIRTGKDQVSLAPTIFPENGTVAHVKDRAGITHEWRNGEIVPVGPSNLKPLEDVKPFRKREGGWGGVTWIGVGSITLLAVGAAVAAWRRRRT